MERREVVILVAAVVVAVTLTYFLLTPRDTKFPFVIRGSPDYLASFLDANAVIIRTIYPFSDAQGAVAASTYLSIVFSAKGKTVILQSIEGNVCYTNEGNVEAAMEKNVDQCDLNLPTIVIREGSGLIAFLPYRVEISGPPPYLMSAAAFVAKKIYPDADVVYQEALARLSRLRSERRA